MNAGPEFLEVEDVLDLHAQQLAIYGGGSGVRDQTLLESAVATPKAREVRIHKRGGFRIRSLRFRPSAVTFDRVSDAELREAFQNGERTLITLKRARVDSP